MTSTQAGSWRRGPVESRTWPWFLAALAIAAILAILALAWQAGGLQDVAAYATVLALLPAVFAVLAWARAAARAAARAPCASTPDQVDAAARMLARQVDRQWREEAATRGVTDPAPLAVRWRMAGLPLGDHRHLAGSMSGRSDEVARFVDRFIR